jgi:hypothetical protein
MQSKYSTIGSIALVVVFLAAITGAAPYALTSAAMSLSGNHYEQITSTKSGWATLTEAPVGILTHDIEEAESPLGHSLHLFQVKVMTGKVATTALGSTQMLHNKPGTWKAGDSVYLDKVSTLSIDGKPSWQFIVTKWKPAGAK